MTLWRGAGGNKPIVPGGPGGVAPDSVGGGSGGKDEGHELFLKFLATAARGVRVILCISTGPSLARSLFLCQTSGCEPCAS